MNYQEKLNGDLISQFRAKPRTNILLEALARQLQEVWQTCQDLQNKRNLNQAVGQQLDGIGDIVDLSRKAADKLLKSVVPNNSGLNDANYRNLLRRKILLNSSSCTYYQLIHAFQAFWPDSEIYCSEDPAFPATLIFSFATLDRQGEPISFGEMPLIHPAGVAVKYYFMLNSRNYLQAELNWFCPEPLLCGTLVSGEKFCGNRQEAS
ncbi:MAG: DUF2612 domain-containing protein [Clostridia bacterium]|nr:DUF2612 domain-containing protein [Clostridia bacterium]